MASEQAKRAASWFVRHVYYRLGPPVGSCVVLMFHRVLPEDQITPWNRDLSISSERFSALLADLQQAFTFVDLFDWIRQPRTSESSLAITFDDGWKDNFDWALRILQRRGATATVFVPTGMVGTNEQFWFDRLARIVQAVSAEELAPYVTHVVEPATLVGLDPVDRYAVLARALKQLPHSELEACLGRIEDDFDVPLVTDRVVVSWTELSAMTEQVFTVGSHGVNHAILVPLRPEERAHELRDSAQMLAGKSLRIVPLISFPNGAYDQDVLDLSSACGYEVMLTASINDCGTGDGDVLVHRIAVNQATTLNDIFLSVFRASWQGKLLTPTVARRRREAR